MTQIVQGFELLTRDSIDNRLLLSKEEMVSVNDNHMPEKYFTVCKDDGMLYLYDKSNELLSDTGKFRTYSSCKIESISINGVKLPITNLNVDIPIATSDKYGVSMAGYGIKAVNGVYRIDFEGIDDKSIPMEKVDFGDALILDCNIWDF